MHTLDGKRVLITGAAAGIGRSMARRFAAEGAHLLLTDIDDAPLTAAADELVAAGRQAWAYPLDVTDADQIAALRDAVHEQGGPIDVLVNNAGVVFGGAFLDVPLEAHLTTMRVNALGPVMLTHAFLPDLISREDAHLVNMASAAGYLAVPLMTTYTASKWATLGFSESILAELVALGHRHVHVTSVCPGYVSTGMFEGAKSPLLTPWLTPDQIADKVVEAVLHNRTHVREPFMVKTIPALKGLLPETGVNAMTQLLGLSSSMRTWHGHTGQ
jgi:all-trans-retinol dehydrogenase (NAD+)